MKRFLLVAIITLLCMGCARQKAEIDGIFLVEGGKGFFVFKTTEEVPKIVQSHFWGSDWTVQQRGSGLRLIQKLENGFRLIDLSASSDSLDWDLEGMTHCADDPNDPIPSLPIPIESYLHRVTNNKILEYFVLLDRAHNRGELDKTQLLYLAENYMNEDPDDWQLQSFYLDALTRSENLEQLDVIYNAWEPDMSVYDNPIFRSMMLNLEWNKRALRIRYSRENAHDHLNALMKVKCDANQRANRFILILKMKYLAIPYPYVGTEELDVDTYLVAARLFYIQALSDLLSGEEDRALKILTAIYWTGQNLSYHSPTRVSLAGATMKDLAANGFEAYLKTSCRTRGDLNLMEEVLKRLQKRERLPSDEEILSLEMLPVNDLKPDMKAVQTRHYYTQAQLTSLRLAVAVCKYQLDEGKNPVVENDLSSYFDEDLPGDPFTYSSMRVLEKEGLMRCYSVGPDGRDDFGLIDYNIGNGLTSQGDIVVSVGDFIEGATKPESPAAFISQMQVSPFFMDPFSTNRLEILSNPIMNATSEWLWSTGPDGDSDLDRRESPLPLREGDRGRGIIYDPTNGILTSGDVLIQVDNGSVAKRNLNENL